MKAIRYIIYILIICLALLLEATFFSNIKLFGASPNLILVIVVSLTIFLEGKDILLITLIGGGIRDLYIGRMLGSNILVFGLIGMLIYRYSNRIIKENIFIALSIIFFSSLIYYLIMGVLLFFVGKGYYINLIYLQNMLLSSVYNLFLGVVIYPITYLIFSKFNKEI